MAVPADPVLRAAVRWLERLPASGAARLRTLFHTHSDFSDITPTQYDTAYLWIREAGLLGALPSRIPVELLVFNAALAHSGAPWLPDADLLVRQPDELPSDALRAAGALGLSEADAYQHLGAVWGKVDTAERARTGAAGELALMELLTASVAGHVEHVAEWSDGFGYDIAVSGHQQSVHLEVKSTTRRSRLTIYLSRHEYGTMLRDPDWELVVVRLDPSLRLAAVATLPKDWIADQAPNDRGPSGRWESCRLDVPSDVLALGIRRLAPLLVSNASEVIRGVAD